MTTREIIEKHIPEIRCELVSVNWHLDLIAKKLLEYEEDITKLNLRADEDEITIKMYMDCVEGYKVRLEEKNVCIKRLLEQNGTL